MIKRWIAYAIVPLSLSTSWFVSVFVGTEGNRTDNGDVCDAIGQSGQYALSFEDWSCDPSWGAIAINILLPTVVAMAFVAAIGEFVRWGLASRPRRPPA